MITPALSFLTFTGIALATMVLASCSSQRMYHGARADIHHPGQQVPQQTWESRNGNLLTMNDPEERYGELPADGQGASETDGSIAASVQLAQVTVTAPMKSVPERLGKVVVDFIVTVPEALMHPGWQLNLTPRLIRDGQRHDLEGLVISGGDFREMQEKQYARYEKYLSRIVPDSLVDPHFLKRRAYNRYIAAHNRRETRKACKDSMAHVACAAYKAKLEKRYGFFNDKTYRNRQWLERLMGLPRTRRRYAHFGQDISHIEAIYRSRYARLSGLLPMCYLWRDLSVEHIRRKYRDGRYEEEYEYNNRLVTASDSVFLKRMFIKEKKVARNRKRQADSHIAYALTVTHPFNEAAYLDTVIHHRGKFEYHYHQEVMAGEESGRMKVCLNGYVMATNGESWLLPRSDTLEYTVSSMIQFLDTTPRTLRRVVERRAVSTLRANLTFQTGRSDMDITLGDNRSQVDRVRQMIGQLTKAGEFVLDSITLSAGCSPEGSFSSNRLLSNRRAESIGKYLKGELSDTEGIASLLKTCSHGEDWQGLAQLVADSLDSPHKRAILDLIAAKIDPDQKESELRERFPDAYRYIRQKLYPRLRAVEFTFHLHRKGMVKDTLHTTEPDTEYARGIELMKQRRYDEALEILHAYTDYNTAVCLMSLGYDRGAYDILVREKQSANGEYLLAILAFRLGKAEEALSRYQRAVELDPTKRGRGMLDPEISRLTGMYNLNREEDF